MLLHVLHVARWTSSLKAATGTETQPQAFISSRLREAVNVFGTCWILCRLYLLGSAALMAVSIFDSQVLVFSSLLYWALQSVTQLLPIKKKINWDATRGLSKTAVTLLLCLFIVSSILTTQPSTLMNQSKHSTGWTPSSNLSVCQTCN